MSNEIAVLRKMAQEKLRPIEEIPKEVLAMQVGMFLTRNRLISAGADKVQARKIANGLLQFREEKMEDFMKKHLHVIPRVGKMSLVYVLATINATCPEPKESEKA